MFNEHCHIVKTTHSISLPIELDSAMRLWQEMSLGDLPGFRIGIVRAVFEDMGTLLDATQSLKYVSNHSFEVILRCARAECLIPSGPEDVA